VRLLCPKCRKLQKEIDFPGIPKEVLERIKSKGGLYQAGGCQDCLNTGFSGRIGLFEVMELTPSIGRLTVQKESSEEIVELCRKEGMKFLHDDGWEKVIGGLTTPQELMRVLGI
jgi:general secretion pathway protein E